jgi:PAS domain S-box-containing protein
VWHRAVQAGGPYETEQRLQNGTTGDYRWFLMQAAPFKDAQGTIFKYVGTCTDIDDRKRAEQQLKESRENLRVLAETVPQLVWTTRPDGRLDYCNQRYCDVTQADFEQLRDYGWHQFLHPEDAERALTFRQHSLETGELFENEHRLGNGQTGGYRWFLARAMPVRDETGQIVKWFGTSTDIHDKKQAEDEIRVLVDAIPQFVWITGPDSSCEYCNQRWCDYTNMTSEQYQGNGWLQAIHPDDQQRVLAVWQRAVQAGGPYEAEQRLRNGITGDYRWFLARGAPLKDAQGTILKYFGTTTDIDDWKQAEQRLKESRENLRVLAETVPQFVWIERPDGYVEYLNQRYIDYLQARPEQLQSDGWSLFLHSDDYQRALATWRHALETGEPHEIEYRLKDGQTGTYRWFLARAMPVRDETGQIVKWFGTSTDIHDKKQAEDELHVLIDAIPQLVWMLRPDGSCEYGNQRWCDYTNMTSEQYQGNGWLQAIHPDDYQHTLAAWRHACASGEPFEIEYRLKDGQIGAYRWFLARAMPVRDETGQIVKWFGTCTDIDEQKRIEEALRQSQERASILMNSSIIGIFVSEDEQVVDANDTYLHMTGYSREDLRAGRISWARMTPAEYIPQTQQAHQELAASHHVTRYEKDYTCKDGSRLPVVVGAIALRLDPFQVIGFVLDNSARKALEQRKDDFISMASHELKTPLTSLQLQTQLLAKQLAKQGISNAAPALSRMEVQGKQLERLIGEFLDVSKIQADRLEYLQEPVDLDALLHEVVDALQPIHPSHTILVRGAGQTHLIGDPDRLGQVFTNLLSNAIKYSPGAKTVEMDLDASKDAVTVHVHDHGLGIPQEQRDKIFERFYRASDPRQKAIPGLGMGLYITAEIVKRHGGTITVDSQMGRGSTFTVTLPRQRRED